MLYREIVAVCSQIHTKHKYIVWAERRIFLVLNLVVHIVTTASYEPGTETAVMAAVPQSSAQQPFITQVTCQNFQPLLAAANQLLNSESPFLGKLYFI